MIHAVEREDWYCVMLRNNSGQYRHDAIQNLPINARLELLPLRHQGTRGFLVKARG